VKPRELLVAARRDWLALAILAVAALAAVVFIAIAMTRPEPPSFAPHAHAVPLDSAGGWKRLTVDASNDRAWRFVSLRTDSVLDRPARLDWDIAVRRFNIATNGGGGFAGQGAAGVDSLIVTSSDTARSGFGKWYDYSFTSHLLTPRQLTYRVRAADGTLYSLRILSYYCPGAQPGCLTIAYQPLATND
jgi:hypothetical protein